jgi:hypothetical protein
MAGVAFTSVQASGVTTTWATVIDIRWQPGPGAPGPAPAANVQIGFYVDEPSYLAGDAPVMKMYYPLDATQINPVGNIPQQIFTQLTAAGAPCAGGTLTS